MTKFTPERLIRVLVAEDYLPYRKFLVETLRRQEQFSIVEVGDGAEAVKKAQELKPDLILLDIGLPSMNGIEAARQIQTVSTASRILFVTQERSIDVVEEALAAGAAAYVIKADAGYELMVAVSAVLRGEKYVSRTLEKDLISTARINIPGQLEGACVFAEQTQPRRHGARRHDVGFYSDDRILLDEFAQVAADGLKTNRAVVVVASELHRKQLLTRLRADGLDMETALDRGLYTPVDNQEVVSAMMDNDLPNTTKFHLEAERLIAKAASSVNGDRSHIVACGESAPLLWAQGNAEGAIRLEQLWDEMGRKYGIRIVCGYPLASFQGGTENETLKRICSEHSGFWSR